MKNKIAEIIATIFNRAIALLNQMRDRILEAMNCLGYRSLV